MIKTFKIVVLKIIIQMVLKVWKKEQESKVKICKVLIYIIKRKIKNYLKMMILMKMVTNMKIKLMVIIIVKWQLKK